jgi:hypothetical protein
MAEEDKVLVVPLLRPLPCWTRYQLLDRSGAVLRQVLAEGAAHLAESGQLPAVTRRFLLRLDKPDRQQQQQQIGQGTEGSRASQQGAERGSGEEADHNLLYEMLAEPVSVSEWLWWQLSRNSRRRRKLPRPEEAAAAVPDDAAAADAPGVAGGNGKRKRRRAEDDQDDVEILESL